MNKAEQLIEDYYRQKVAELTTIKRDFPKIIRYDLVEINLGPSGTMAQMESSQDGEWIHYDDIKELLESNI